MTLASLVTLTAHARAFEVVAATQDGNVLLRWATPPGTSAMRVYRDGQLVGSAAPLSDGKQVVTTLGADLPLVTAPLLRRKAGCPTCIVTFSADDIMPTLAAFPDTALMLGLRTWRVALLLGTGYLDSGVPAGVHQYEVRAVQNGKEVVLGPGAALQIDSSAGALAPLAPAAFIDVTGAAATQLARGAHATTFLRVDPRPAPAQRPPEGLSRHAAFGYRVERRLATPAGQPWSALSEAPLLLASPPAPGLAYSVADQGGGKLVPGQSYQYRVAARDGFGQPGAWLELTTSPRDTRPPLPPHHMAAAVDRVQQRVTLTWTAPEAGVTYLVETAVGHIGGAWKKPLQAPCAGQSACAVVQDIPLGARRWFRVFAIDAAGNQSAPSAPVFAVMPGPRVAPVSKLSSSCGGQVCAGATRTLSWPAVPGASAYRVCRRIGAGDCHLVAELRGSPPPASFSDSFQPQRTTALRYQVTPLNAALEPSASTTIDLVAAGSAPPAAPAIIDVKRTIVGGHVEEVVTFQAPADTHAVYALWKQAPGGDQPLVSDLAGKSGPGVQSYQAKLFTVPDAMRTYFVIAKDSATGKQSQSAPFTQMPEPPVADPKQVGSLVRSFDVKAEPGNGTPGIVLSCASSPGEWLKANYSPRYLLFRSQLGPAEGFYQIALPLDACQYVDTSVVPGRTYYYQFVELSQGYDESLGEIVGRSAVTALTAPGAPPTTEKLPATITDVKALLLGGKLWQVPGADLLITGDGVKDGVLTAKLVARLAEYPIDLTGDITVSAGQSIITVSNPQVVYRMGKLAGGQVIANDGWLAAPFDVSAFSISAASGVTAKLTQKAGKLHTFMSVYPSATARKQGLVGPVTGDVVLVSKGASVDFAHGRITEGSLTLAISMRLTDPCNPDVQLTATATPAIAARSGALIGRTSAIDVSVGMFRTMTVKPLFYLPGGTTLQPPADHLLEVVHKDSALPSSVGLRAGFNLVYRGAAQWTEIKPQLVTPTASLPMVTPQVELYLRPHGAGGTLTGGATSYQYAGFPIDFTSVGGSFFGGSMASSVTAGTLTVPHPQGQGAGTVLAVTDWRLGCKGPTSGRVEPPKPTTLPYWGVSLTARSVALDAAKQRVSIGGDLTVKHLRDPLTAGFTFDAQGRMPADAPAQVTGGADNELDGFPIAVRALAFSDPTAAQPPWASAAALQSTLKPGLKDVKAALTGATQVHGDLVLPWFGASETKAFVIANDDWSKDYVFFAQRVAVKKQWVDGPAPLAVNLTWVDRVLAPGTGDPSQPARLVATKPVSWKIWGLASDFTVLVSGRLPKGFGLPIYQTPRVRLQSNLASVMAASEELAAFFDQEFLGTGKTIGELLAEGSDKFPDADFKSGLIVDAQVWTQVLFEVSKTLDAPKAGKDFQKFVAAVLDGALGPDGSATLAVQYGKAGADLLTGKAKLLDNKLVNDVFDLPFQLTDSYLLATFVGDDLEGIGGGATVTSTGVLEKGQSEIWVSRFGQVQIKLRADVAGKTVTPVTAKDGVATIKGVKLTAFATFDIDPVAQRVDGELGVRNLKIDEKGEGTKDPAKVLVEIPFAAGVFGVGKGQAYLGARGTVKLEKFELEGAFLLGVGIPADLAPDGVPILDAAAQTVLAEQLEGAGTMSGFYLAGGYSPIPIIDLTCMCKLEAGGKVSVWAVVASNGKLGVGLSLTAWVAGTLLCLITARGDLTLAANFGDATSIYGSAKVSGKVDLVITSFELKAEAALTYTTGKGLEVTKLEGP